MDGECAPIDPWGDYQWSMPADRTVNGEADPEAGPLVGQFNQLRQLKQRYPDLTVLLSLGGGGSHSEHFPETAATEESRESYVAACVDTYLRGNLPTGDDHPHGGPGAAEGIFDGLDVDWEWPSIEDRDNLTALLGEFRRQLDSYGDEAGRRFSLTVSLPAVPREIEEGFDVPEVLRLADVGFILAFDMYAPWNEDNLVTNHHAQLYSPDDNGETYLNYDEIEELPGTTHLDEGAVGAFRYDGDAWATYDTPETATRRAAYVRERSLGGVVVSSLDGDVEADLVTAIASGLG